MKPLIIFKFDDHDYDQEKEKSFMEAISPMHKDYDILIIWGGCDVKVYNIPFFINVINKIKTWFILKTMNRKLSSHTSRTK